VLAEGSAENVLASGPLRAAYGIETRTYPDPITGHLRLVVLGNGARQPDGVRAATHQR
jgi:hypothetical protein